MIRILFALLLLASASRAVDTLSIPTDFNSVTTGTRANLSSNFTAIGTWGNKIRDTLAPVTARMGGYTGSLVISSLSNLRLKLDADNSETARLLVESGNGDSLFRVSEDTTARFFRHLRVDSNLTVIGRISVTDSILGASARFTGKITTDSLISSKFYEEGTFTATLTGVTTTVTGTARYVRVGKSVTLYIPALTGTSNSTACTITGIPASIALNRQQTFPGARISDNSTDYMGYLLANSTTINFVRWTAINTIVAFTFTNSGTKGLAEALNVSYTLQ